MASRRTRIVSSDDESSGHEREDSETDLLGGSQHKDISTITDPKELQEIIREMQLERNMHRSRLCQQLGDVTNTPGPIKRKKNRHRGSGRKRPRVTEEFDAAEPSTGSHEDDTDKSDSVSNSEADIEADDNETKVKRAGCLFVLNYGLWVKGNARIFDIDIDPAYDEKKRFDTAANKIQGQLREIESILPKVDSKRRKSWIARMFMAGVTSQRPNTSTRMRRTAGAAIFDCSPADLLVPEDHLQQFRDQIGWYVDDAGSGAYSSLDVPILHADWAGEYDFKTCFLNPCLMRLYIALIRGPSAATTQLKHDKAKAGSEVILSIQKCENMEHIFIMDHTEPGAIAGSAVLAIWALSADTSLRDHGDRTSIDYGARFDQYLEILLVGLREKSESILNIFKEWDRVVFPNSESGYAGTIQSGPGDGGNQRALEALRAKKQAAAEGDTH